MLTDEEAYLLLMLDWKDYFHAQSVQQYYFRISFSFHSLDSIDDYQLKVKLIGIPLALLSLRLILVEIQLIQLRTHHQSKYNIQ